MIGNPNGQITRPTSYCSIDRKGARMFSKYVLKRSGVIDEVAVSGHGGGGRIVRGGGTDGLV
jgi:hypothetical protein